MASTEDKPRAALEAEVASLTGKVRELKRQVEEFEQREKVMLQKERVLHATLDSAADGILAVNEEGRVVFANRQFARMWHIPPDLIEAGDDNELLDFVLDQLVDPEAFLARVRELYQSFKHSTDMLHFKDGRVFERDSLPLVLENKLHGRVWTFHDVTSPELKSGSDSDTRHVRREVF